MTHPLPPVESLTIEFKSDRKRLPDSELIEAVVCLANAEEGGSKGENGWNRMRSIRFRMGRI